jgi:hypothetical protein
MPPDWKVRNSNVSPSTLPDHQFALTRVLSPRRQF